MFVSTYPNKLRVGGEPGSTVKTFTPSVHSKLVKVLSDMRI